eukprot:15069958-Heterocapsa_arctica.AAC.1
MPCGPRTAGSRSAARAARLPPCRCPTRTSSAASRRSTSPARTSAATYAALSWHRCPGLSAGRCWPRAGPGWETLRSVR